VLDLTCVPDVPGEEMSGVTPPQDAAEVLRHGAEARRVLVSQFDGFSADIVDLEVTSLLPLPSSCRHLGSSIYMFMLPPVARLLSPYVVPDDPRCVRQT
jgi:hypothetical protein